jgi:hypothetical protein
MGNRLALVAVLALVGCGNGDEETSPQPTGGTEDPTGGSADPTGGVVLSFTIASEGDDCLEQVDENILGAEAPDPGTDASWVNDSGSSQQSSTGFALLSGAVDGTVVVSLWGDAYVGTRDGDTITVTSDYAFAYEYTSSVPAAAFAYVYAYDYEQDAILTLTLQDDGHTWTGTLDEHSINNSTWQESDVYDVVAYNDAGGFPYFSGGTLTNAVFNYLAVDTFASNTGDVVDCEEELCAVTVGDDCTEVSTVTAVETDMDPAAFNVY